MVCVLIVVALAVGWLTARPGGSGPGATSTATGVQRTALLALRDGDQLVGAALLSVSAQDGLAVLVPAELVLEVPGIGRQPLDAAFGVRSRAPAEALSDALGVRIDGTWVLSASGLGALVDAVGGVNVDVDQDLDWRGVQLAEGRGQRLNGRAAAAFASYRHPDEPAASQLARFSAVLTGLLAGLPPKQETIDHQLRALGAESNNLLPPGRLAEMLLRARGLAQGEGWRGLILPIKVLDAGGASVESLDTAAARDLVESHLPGARLPEPTGGVVRVMIRNGVGVPRLSEAARDRLVAAGLRFVAGGNADSFGRRTTVVLVASDSRVDREHGLRVARALGLSPSQIQVNPLGSAMADVVVVLGQDFADDVARPSVRG
jgi:hypothetical protein